MAKPIVENDTTKPTPAAVEKTTRAAEQPGSQLQPASKWFQEAIDGATEMHRNDEIRKEVARRLF